MSYEHYREEYKGFTITIQDEEGAPEPYFSFLGRFVFFGCRNYIDIIDDDAYLDFDLSLNCYTELVSYDVWDDESGSLLAELKRKRYEFREVWRNGHGDWVWGEPNVLRQGEREVEGIFYVTPERIRQEYGHKIATKRDRTLAQEALAVELDIWRHWASGEVYYWTVDGPDGFHDSCGGYYEDYMDYGTGEALYPILAAREAVDDHLKWSREAA